MRYDLDELRDSLDAIETAGYLGIEIMRRGRNSYIRCPEHFQRLGKEDRSIGNCVLSGKGYYCFACGAHGDAIKLVQLTENLNFRDAVLAAAKASGIDISGYAVGESKEKFPLTAHELNLIGLKKTCCGIHARNFIVDKGDCPENWQIYKNASCLDTDAFTNGYDVGPAVKYSLAELWKESRHEFAELVRGKIRETQMLYLEVLESGFIHGLFKKQSVAVKFEQDMIKELEEVNRLAAEWKVPCCQYKGKQNGRFYLLKGVC